MCVCVRACVRVRVTNNDMGYIVERSDMSCVVTKK